MSPATGAVVFVGVIVAVLLVRVWTILLRDLAGTGDEDLRYLTRKGWMVAIVATFPFGAIMYLLYGKGSGRYR